MTQNNSFWKVVAPIVGAVILIFVVYIAVGRFRSDLQAQREAEPAAAAVEASAAQGEQPVASQAEATTAEEAAPAAEEPAAAPAATATSAPAPAASVAGTAPADVVAAFNRGGCAGCHTIAGIPGANGTVGPDLSNLGAVAASRREGYTAEEYIRESILDPNAFIAPECPSGACPSGVMLQTFAQTLSQDDLDTIVGYLATLGTEQMAALTTEAAAPAALSATLPPESILSPFIPLPKEPAKEAQIALGKYLFFDSRLSGNNSLSCASCHNPDKAFTDGQALSRGYPSTSYFRNTPTVLNSVFADRLYWDGRMDGSDMPTLVRDHLTEAHFMSMDGRLMVERLRQIPAYVDLFQEAFGGEPSFGKVLNAITAYVQTLNSQPSPYDRYMAGEEDAISEDAKTGLALFQTKGKCSSCHNGSLFTDGGFYNTGVGTDLEMFNDPERQLTFRRFFRTLGVPNFRNLWDDVGFYALTMDEADWGKFRTPSLREVSRTAPYMHNGSLASLEDVVQFYNNGGGPDQTAGLEPLNLTDTEVGQLVAFLETLSSDPIPVEPPVLPDYGILPLGAPEAEAPAAPAEAAAQPTEQPAEEATPVPEEATPAPEEAAGAPEDAVAAITKAGCTACHVIPGVPGAVGMVGPDLSNIGAEAATRVEGMSAEEYIHQSIVDPNAVIAPKCPTGDCLPGLMPQTFADMLTTDEIDAIVNYLATLGSGR